MNNNVMNLLKDRPLYIPSLLLYNYRKMKITDSELIILIVIMSYGEKVIYDLSLFANIQGLDKHEIMTFIDSLIDKNILSLVVEKEGRKTTEYISCASAFEFFYCGLWFF